MVYCLSLYSSILLFSMFISSLFSFSSTFLQNSLCNSFIFCAFVPFSLMHPSSIFSAPHFCSRRITPTFVLFAMLYIHLLLPCLDQFHSHLILFVTASLPPLLFACFSSHFRVGVHSELLFHLLIPFVLQFSHFCFHSNLDPCCKSCVSLKFIFFSLFSCTIFNWFW